MATAATSPPRTSSQEVSISLDLNRQTLTRQLARYNAQHEVLVNGYGSTRLARIYSQDIKHLAGKAVVPALRFQVGAGHHSQGYTASCGVLELKWIDAALEFVGQRKGCT
jgi:hypothetical protein